MLPPVQLTFYKAAHKAVGLWNCMRCTCYCQSYSRGLHGCLAQQMLEGTALLSQQSGSLVDSISFTAA